MAGLYTQGIGRGRICAALTRPGGGSDVGIVSRAQEWRLAGGLPVHCSQCRVGLHEVSISSETNDEQQDQPSGAHPQ